MDLLTTILICGLSAPAPQLYGIIQTESGGRPETVIAGGSQRQHYPDLASTASAAAMLVQTGPVRAGLAGLPVPSGSTASSIAPMLAPCKQVALAAERWNAIAESCQMGTQRNSCVAARWHDGPPDMQFAADVAMAAEAAPRTARGGAGDASNAQSRPAAELTDGDAARSSDLFPQGKEPQEAGSDLFGSPVRSSPVVQTSPPSGASATPAETVLVPKAPQ